MIKCKSSEVILSGNLTITKTALLRVLRRSWILWNFKMVPEAGLEPARPKDRQILNLLCLPISPLGQSAFTSVRKEKVEARSGVEPD